MPAIDVIVPVFLASVLTATFSVPIPMITAAQNVTITPDDLSAALSLLATGTQIWTPGGTDITETAIPWTGTDGQATSWTTVTGAATPWGEGADTATAWTDATHDDTPWT